MADDPRSTTERRIDDLEGDLYDARRELRLLQGQVERAVDDLNRGLAAARDHRCLRLYPEAVGALEAMVRFALNRLGQETAPKAANVA